MLNKSPVKKVEKSEKKCLTRFEKRVIIAKRRIERRKEVEKM